MTARQRQQSANRLLGSMIVWLPVLLIPFSVLFAETWMQLQIRDNDYEMWQMQTDLNATDRSIQMLEVRDSQLRTVSRIDATAPDIGLVKPEPNQIVVIHAHVNAEKKRDRSPFSFARLLGTDRTGAANRPAAQ